MENITKLVLSMVNPEVYVVEWKWEARLYGICKLEPKALDFRSEVTRQLILMYLWQ